MAFKIIGLTKGFGSAIKYQMMVVIKSNLLLKTVNMIKLKNPAKRHMPAKKFLSES